jgi:phospholipase C
MPATSNDNRPTIEFPIANEENHVKPISGALYAAAIGAVSLALGACSSTAPSVLPSTSAGTLARTHHQTNNPIQHIVIIVQENRSFNNLFYGFPGATTQSYGYDSSGNKIKLGQIGLQTTWDIEHDLSGFITSCNGTGTIPGTDCQNNGFNREYWGCGSDCPDPVPPYSYVPHSETKPYFWLGRHYVLADQMYASNLDASSFISHQYIIAAQAQSAVNYPENYWGCPGSQYYGKGNDQIYTITSYRGYGGLEDLCWNEPTIGSEMDDAGLTWHFYTGAINGDGNIWNAYQNIEPIYYGSDWKNDVITPQTQFFSDIEKGTLSNVTWITPTCENSDHAGCGSDTGPAWVASLVNAIGESKFWDSTAIFIMWDDYGGWYDPEPPAYKDYDGLGMRIPLLIVSPYARKGVVDHTQYEHGSILKFVEDTFGLSTLAASDKRATAPDAAFDFSAKPRKFRGVPSPHDIEFFKHQKPDLRNPDPG